MVHWLLKARLGFPSSLYTRQGEFNYQQKYSLVNVKLKWVKDGVLDSVVAGEKDLRAACTLLYIIASDPQCCLPVYRLSRHRGQLGLPDGLKVSTFLRRYPNLYEEVYIPDSGGTRVPWFRLTPEAINLNQEQSNIVQQCHKDLLDRLCKLLMLTKERTLPLQTIDQLRWDIGLPYDYHQSLIPYHQELFSEVKLPDDRLGLKLLYWDEQLAVSHLQKIADLPKKENDVKNETLCFPIGFTRGFGLKRKSMQWLDEWKRLPYTSPYVDASYLDSRTDVFEKRIVGVFHELLHLTIGKKTERKNVSNLRKPLVLPQKFTKVFERHPGIFYISKKCDAQTVVLREGYDCQQLVQKHPLAEIREKYAAMMRKGFLDRSRGLYKRSVDAASEKIFFGGSLNNHVFQSEGESDSNMISEYESD